jgi:hypothetical protein
VIETDLKPMSEEVEEVNILDHCVANSTKHNDAQQHRLYNESMQHELDKFRNNPLLHQCRILVHKRQQCRWCNQLLPNLIAVQECLASQNAPHSVVIEELATGRVPAIYFQLHFPTNDVAAGSSSTVGINRSSGDKQQLITNAPDYQFKYEESERSTLTLLSIYLLFATVIYPVRRFVHKFGHLTLEWIQLHWSKRIDTLPYPNNFISFAKVEEQLIQWKYQCPRECETQLKPLFRNGFQENCFLLFYILNSQHTRAELFRNVYDDSVLQVFNEEINKAFEVRQQ